MQATIFNKYIFPGHWANLLCTMQHYNLQYRIFNKYNVSEPDVFLMHNIWYVTFEICI